MAATIQHRGPDSDGQSSSDFADIAFKRLAIIDRLGGSQPLSNEDCTIECFLNGEIYNFATLREELKSRGHIFRTSSDTEVLPHLYEELGPAMFARLNGMFSVCVVDHRKREVLIARDPFGVKPMYYAATPLAVVFASELKAVLASGIVQPEIDQSNVLAYLTLFYSPGPRTLAKGVSKLPPGCFIRLTPRGVSEPSAFYTLARHGRGGSLNGRAPAAQVLQLLKDSVGLQLQADVPVGISLSGGLDSSALTYAAATLSCDREPMALTVTYQDMPQDEVESAAALCQHLSVKHLVLSPGLQEIVDELPLLAWLSDEPVADPALYSQLCISRTAAKHVKVLLSGAGADELFGGYNSYFLSWPRGLYAGLPAPLRRSLRWLCFARGLSEDEVSGLGDYERSRLLMHSYSMSSINRRQQDTFRQRLGNSRDPYEHFRVLFDRYAHQDPATQQMLVDLYSYLPDQVLPMIDRAMMGASIEGRVPFLDMHLVEFAFSLPSKVKLGPSTLPKWLLKEALAPYIPGRILTRRKSGLPSPARRLIRALHDEMLPAILLGPDSYVRTIVPRPFLRGALASSDAAVRSWRLLYGLLILEIWHKLFIRDRVYTKPRCTVAELFCIPNSKHGVF